MFGNKSHFFSLFSVLLVIVASSSLRSVLSEQAKEPEPLDCTKNPDDILCQVDCTTNPDDPLCTPPSPTAETSSETQTINGFSLYQSDLFGFSVQYPVNWIRHETDISGSFSNEILATLRETGVARPVVDFCPAGTVSSSTTTSISPCLSKPDSISISVFDGLGKSDRSLDSFTEKQINQHTTANNVIVKSEPTNISGLPAQRIHTQ